MLGRTPVLKTFSSMLLLALTCLIRISGFAQLNGTKTIGGTAPDYMSIEAAFTDLNAQGVAVPGVTFLIRTGTYVENPLVIRTSTTSASAPIVIKPAAGATVRIDVTPTGAPDCAIKVDATKYVTLDGSNSGSTSRDMTINSLGGAGQRGVWFSGNCSYGTIKNCVVTASRDIDQPGTTSRGIDFFYLVGTGNDTDYGLIENNLVRYAHTGIRLEGVIGGDVMESTIVRNNVVDSVCNAGIYSQYHNSTLIYNNDINVKRGGFTGGFNPAMYGINVGVFTSKVRVYNNRVHDLNQLSTTTLVTYGVYVSSTASLGRHSVFNNFVWGINVPEHVAGTGGVYGIYSGITNSIIPDTIAFNTVTISGASGGIRPSYAFYKGSATGPAIAWNNILINTRTDSPAVAAAIGTLSTATLLSSNYNNLYVPVTADTNTNIGVIGTVRYKSLSSWSTASNSDSRSVTENAPFVSASDLHIQTSVPTQLESGGIPVAGIITDIDGQTRNATTPDIGADEGTFTLLDLTGPAIAHTALSSTPSTGNRIVAATLTDLSGVATGSGAPRLWHRINAAATYTAVAADSTVGNIRYFTIPGSAAGSTVRYYLAAQDLAPTNNVSTLPSGGSGLNPPGSAAPSTVFSYFVQTAIPAGTYTVGISGNYPTIDSVFRKLSIDGVAGAVTFTLTDTAYVALGKPLQNLRLATPRYAIVNGEREELALPSAYEFDAPTEAIPALTLTGPIVGASSTNRITFRPAAGRAVRILGSGAWVIRLLDASYVTFDGINSGGASLRLQAIAGAGLQIEGNSDNVIVQNMQIGTPNFTAILLQSAASGIPDSTLVQRNTVDSYSLNGFFGVNLVLSTGLARGIRISNNNFGTSTDSLMQAGALVQHTEGAWIHNNTIRNLKRAGSTWGIGVQTRHYRTRVWNNKVFDTRTSGPFGGTNRGISMFGTTGDTTRSTMYNNMIFDLDYQSINPFGSIRALVHYGGLFDTIAYNSIRLTGITTVPSPTVGLYIGNGLRTSNVTVLRNNNVVNTRTPTGVGFGLSLAVFYADSLATSLISSNHNNLFVGTAAGSHVGAHQNTLYTTLAAWRTASGGDTNSINVNANFVAPDLHIDSTIATPINGGAIPIAGITTDIDGQPRNTTAPDIGADEFSYVPTGVNDPTAGIPKTFGLAQNYPNPFNPNTTITFALPDRANVSLKVYNLLGQEVVTLAQGNMPAAFHSVAWSGRNSVGAHVATGMYFYRMEATGASGEKFNSVKKLILLK